MDQCGWRDNEFPGFLSAQEAIASGWVGGLPVGDKVTRFSFTAGDAASEMLICSPVIVFIHV